jgi:hypothetical protein
LLRTGSARIGRKVELAAPDKNDWLLVIKGSGRLELASEQPPLPEVVSSAEGAIVLKAVRDFRIVPTGGFVPAYKDSGHDALIVCGRSNRRNNTC